MKLDLTQQELNELKHAIEVLKKNGAHAIVRGLESILNRSNPDVIAKYAPYILRHPEDKVISTTLCNGFTLDWTVKNVGFGQFSFSDSFREDGSQRPVEIWNETMGREFIKHTLNHMVDNAKLMEEL
jgi:hypothetical protein